MRFFSWTDGSCDLLQTRAITGFAEFFFSFLSLSLSSVFWHHGYIPSLYKSSMVVCCSQVCKIWIMYVLMTKQEIERQTGLEKVGGARSTFYISRILLSKISKLCMCLKWGTNLMVSLTVYGSLVNVGWYSVNTTNSPLPSRLCVYKRRMMVNLSQWVSSHAADHLTLLKDEGRNLQP